MSTHTLTPHLSPFAYQSLPMSAVEPLKTDLDIASRQSSVQLLKLDLVSARLLSMMAKSSGKGRCCITPGWHF